MVLTSEISVGSEKKLWWEMVFRARKKVQDSHQELNRFAVVV
jgi:hypothetical protein